MTRFPDSFSWGVASAAFQVEGSPEGDGRGSSVWDDFCKIEGAVHQGHTGEVACDSYNRIDEDIALIHGLGVNSYRFSISWPRLIPDGLGADNEAGYGYYDRMIDALLERGIEPWVTLYHWDMPSTLQSEGGWLNPESPDWFERYTRRVVERFSDRVSHWFTLNEPQIFLGHGHREGNHAPGLKLSRREVLLATHHALLAHGRSAQTIRAHAKKTPRIGFAPAGCLHIPHTDSSEDIEAAREATFGIHDDNWTYNYSWYCDPVILGEFPEHGLSSFGADVPKHSAADLETMCQPLDLFGVNIYGAGIARRAEDGSVERLTPKRGAPITMFRWEIEPSSLYYGPKFLAERYKLPVYITENGLASMDWVHADGKVHDPGRIDYLTRHLSALRRAHNDGVDIRGYFHWSILDNFEWAEGYALRFGLVYMDYERMRRIPKDSYHWFREVVRTQGEQLPDNPVSM